MSRGDRKSESQTAFQDARLLIGGDPSDTLPRVDGGGVLLQFPCHWPDTAEQCEKRDKPLHVATCVKISNKMQGKNSKIRCAKISQFNAMEPVYARLRELRKSAQPKLTVRGIAAALDMPFGTYSFYETAKYKKPNLPLDLTRKIAGVLSGYGVDAAEVMKLAGLSEGEAEPEAREIEATPPKVQFFTAQVVMPSEAALAAMLEPLLAMIPPEATLAEAARMLARRLPGGFAAIGPAVLEVHSDEETEHDEPLPVHAISHREQPSR